MTTLVSIILALVVVGAINWGLVGFFNWNLISAIFGEKSPVSRVIYALVGLAGIYTIFLLSRMIPCAASSGMHY